MVSPRLIIFFINLSYLIMVYSLHRSVLQVSTEVPQNASRIPTTPSFYEGPNAPPVDNCPRDEVRLPNGQCYQLLTQGPCMSREFILLNPVTLKGYCAPRLCSPDRIFVFSNQLCHDPRDQQICQGGKQLYQTSFGTPICQCPEGTYESDDDDLEDRGCEPMLSAASSCPPGQVFWFRNFRSPRECLDDPCGRENLQRSLQQHLLVPFAGDGNCYAVGQRGVCPQGTWYTLALSQLRGVCSTLEDSGYLVLDARQLADFETFYGPFIPKFQDEFSFVKPNVLPINSIPSNVASQRALHSRFLPFQAEPNTDGDIIGISVSYSPVLLGPVTADRVTEERIELQTPSKKLYAAPLVSHSSRKYQNIPETELIKGHLATEIRVSGRTDGVFSSQMSDIISVPIAQKFNSTASGIQFAKTVVAIIDSMSAVSWGATAAENIKNKRRLRRDIPLAHFTPGNIFDTRLVACRAGAQIGANAKCRDIILPPRSPSRPPLGPPHFEGPAPLSFSPEREAGRQSRSAPPIKPQPPCPRDETYNNQRQCVPQNMVASNIIPIRLG